MSLSKFMERFDMWLREQNHKNLQRKAAKLEVDAKFAKLNAPYKKRIMESKEIIKANTPKKDPLDMKLEL